MQKGVYQRVLMIHWISWKAIQAWKLYTGPMYSGEMRSQLLKECFSKCAPRPVASTSPGHLVEMKILRPPPRPTEETLGMRANNQYSNKFSRRFWCTVKFENHCLSMVLKKAPWSLLPILWHWWNWELDAWNCKSSPRRISFICQCACQIASPCCCLT